jgi:hypothetical protein
MISNRVELGSSRPNLREKYQERYAFLPGKKVPGSSVIPL